MSDINRITLVAAPLIGPLIWFFHLSLSYGASTLMCEAGAPSWRVQATLGVWAAIAMAALYLAWNWILAPKTRVIGAKNQAEAFLVTLGAWLTALSAIAVIWHGLTVVAIPPC
jgi:hypothetical protein